MIESQVVKERTELFMNRGVEKGLEKAREEGLLLRILCRPPLLLPAHLEQAIRAVTDLARIDAALGASSVEEFRRTTGL